MFRFPLRIFTFMDGSVNALASNALSDNSNTGNVVPAWSQIQTGTQSQIAKRNPNPVKVHSVPYRHRNDYLCFHQICRSSSSENYSSLI